MQNAKCKMQKPDAIDAEESGQSIKPLLLAALFFISGISGLIYQSLWLRMLSLVFGVTVYAAATVLASFMAGLAIGTLIAGRLTTRVRRPLAWFGAIELGIGVFAFLTPWALDLAGEIWVALEPRLPSALWAVTAGRFICSLVVLLAPTALMGATLPLVVRSSLSERSLASPWVGVLYAANTAGAIAGALLAGFVLIGGIGIARSFQLAAALNTFVAMGAFTLALRDTQHSTPSAPVPMASPVSRIAQAAFAFSGFAALALEIVWFRVLVIIVPATTYAFTTMLAAVLLGLAAGSALAAPLLRRAWNWPAVYGAIQLVIGLLTVGAIGLYLDWYGAGSVRGSDHVASLFVIVPPALAMGVAFPVGIRAWVDTPGAVDQERAARVARLYAVNVGGAIAGAVAGGFLLLPGAGSRVSLIVLGAGFILSGVLLMWHHTPVRRLPFVASTVVAVTAFAWLAVRLPTPFAAVQGRRVPADERPLFLEEGVQTTVGVYADPTGRRVMYLDGLHQANDTEAMVQVHRQIGLLPAAIHPSPHNALVIGLGGGVTGGALGLLDHLPVEIVELSDSVLRGSRWFRHVNGDVLSRRNVHLRIDDGRNHLTTTPNRYDIITADIIQPIHAGAGSLYSAEYYRLAKDALMPGGLMLQWIGNRPESQYKLLVRTFLDVFPHTTAWAGGTLLVGTTAPLTLDPDSFRGKLLHEGTRRALESIGLASFEALLARYTAGPDELRAFVGPGLILTDDRPLVEYHRSLPANEPEIDLSGLKGSPDRWISK
jgi:spermidine synthase